MTVLGIVLVFLAAVVLAVANFMLRWGITNAGGFAPATVWDVPVSLFGLFRQPWFSAGFVLYFLGTLLWFRVMAMERLSIAYPTLVGLTFVMVSGGAMVLFNEPPTARTLAALFLILAGILLLSLKTA